MDKLSLLRFIVHAHPLLLYCGCLLLVSLFIGQSRCLHILRLSRRPVFTPLVLITFAVVLLAYIALPQYSDHAEPSIAAVSWIVARGASPYHSPEGPESYAFPYGPVLYLANAAVMRTFGATLPTSKLLGTVCALTSVLVVGLTAARRRTSATAAVLACLVAYLAFGTASFRVRAEPLLLLYVSLGLLSTTIHGVAGSSLLGVALGLSAATKITGLLYLAPAAVAITRNRGWHAVAIGCASALFAFALPFALSPSVRVADYLYWLGTAADHGIRWQSLPALAEWAMLLCAPLLPALYADRHPQGRLTSMELAARLTLAIGLVGSVVIAAKRGTGPYHFLPFVPSIAIFAQRPLAHNRLHSRTPWPRLLVAFGLTFILLAATAQAYWLVFLAADAQRGPLAELSTLSRKYQGPIAVGYSTNYRLSFLRPVPVFAGEPYQIDAVALMDADIAGRRISHNILQSLSACRMRVWIIPRGGVPFELYSAYDGTRPVFGETFIQLFRANYSLVHSGHHYDVWRCSH